MMKTILLALAGLFAAVTVVLGFIGLLNAQGISQFALVSLLVSVVLLALFLAARQRDAANK